MNSVITIDTRQFDKFFAEAPEKMESSALRAIGQQLVIIQKTAKKEHRYMSTSGRRPSGRYYRNTHNLERSVVTELDRKARVGMVYLDTGIAKYGPHIHKGFKSWKPDEFLYAAFNKQLSQVQPAINAALNQTVFDLSGRI
jgi:hypothetical protein